MAEEKGKGVEKKDEKAAKGKEAAPEEAPEGGEAEKKKRPLVFKIILFSTLAVALIGVVIFVSSKVASNQNDPYQAEKPEKKDEERGHKTVTILETFELSTKSSPDFKMVIAQGGEQHNLKCIITLGYSDEYKKKGLEFEDELKKVKPALREKIYRVLGSKKLEDLQIGNMQNLEDELLLRLNEDLVHGKIADIMFEEYILQ